MRHGRKSGLLVPVGICCQNADRASPFTGQAHAMPTICWAVQVATLVPRSSIHPHSRIRSRLDAHTTLAARTPGDCHICMVHALDGLGNLP
jgi:hypothetical protein